MVPGWFCPKCGAVRRGADDTCHGVKPLSHTQADHIIAARKKGKDAELEPPAQSRDSNVVDLMERLRRSLEGTGRSSRKVAAPRAKGVRARKAPARTAATRARRRSRAA